MREESGPYIRAPKWRHMSKYSSNDSKGRAFAGSLEVTSLCFGLRWTSTNEASRSPVKKSGGSLWLKCSPVAAASSWAAAMLPVSSSSSTSVRISSSKAG